ncbi:endoplasmic reticulum protein [Flagelloscypha sp. PMI_526]|nr:endoplasmic reticulum protein [Flagelloscypha sp. PMI_526]
MFPPYSFTKQPLKGLYLTYQIVSTVFFRLPLWTLLAIPPWFRQRKSWTFQRELAVNALRHLVVQVDAQVGNFLSIPDHTKLDIRNGVEGVWIEPVCEALLQYDILALAATAQVKAVKIPAYWHNNTGEMIESNRRAQPNEKIFLFFHGGAYISLSAHPSDTTAHAIKGLIHHTGFQRALSVEYRLSSTAPLTTPTNPFPAALLDALSSYLYLVDTLGFPSAQIVVCGDSAGGNLALQLTRYLVENAGIICGLPSAPSALILLSPWVDIYDLRASDPDSSFQINANTDYLRIREQPGYAETAFTGVHGLGIALYNRYISPAGVHPTLLSSLTFKGFPKTFVTVGGAEVLHDQIIRLKERLVRDIGEDKVGFYRAPDAIHDYTVFPWHEPERSDTLAAIAAWM